MKIIDISQKIEAGMVVYPKNPTVEVETLNTGYSTISKITLGSHTGTHLDAPAHVLKGGVAVTDLPLDVFIGPCRVLDMMHINFGEGIKTDDLKKENIQKGEKIIVKTKNSLQMKDLGLKPEVFSLGIKQINAKDALNTSEFFDDYIFLTGDAADFLATKEISLFGIDSLSVKKRGGTDNRAHTSLLEKNIPIIEGLVLGDVFPKEYLFVGFPLKLTGLDGSPLRAVLIED